VTPKITHNIIQKSEKNIMRHFVIKLNRDHQKIGKDIIQINLINDAISNSDYTASNGGIIMKNKS
jgi:hypothetical protein